MLTFDKHLVIEETMLNLQRVWFRGYFDATFVILLFSEEPDVFTQFNLLILAHKVTSIDHFLRLGVNEGRVKLILFQTLLHLHQPTSTH